MKKTDIALICIIVILALTCVAAGVLGYFTEGWTNWATLSETTTVVDDNSLSTESDGEIELLSSGYAFTSAESGYIEKAFLTLTAWASYWDIRKDIEWTVNYPNEYAAKKVSFSVAEDNVEGTLCCTGVFWGTITVSISLGDVQSSVKVSFSPRYQALGLTDCLGEYDNTDMPLASSEYWPVYPTFESRDFHTEFVTGYASNNIRIGLVNQFGELELIDQDGRSIYEQCEVSEPNNPVVDVDIYYGGPTQAYRDANDGKGFDRESSYATIAKNSSKYTAASERIFDCDDSIFPDETYYSNLIFELASISYSTEPMSFEENRNRAITKCPGEYEGHIWKGNYAFGISEAYANTYDYSNIYGDWTSDPYFYTGFSYNFDRGYSAMSGTFYESAPFYSTYFAYDANFERLSPITITFVYGEYRLEFSFDFSRYLGAPV